MMAGHLGLDEPDDAKDAFKCLDSKGSGRVAFIALFDISQHYSLKLSLAFLLSVLDIFEIFLMEEVLYVGFN